MKTIELCILAVGGPYSAACLAGLKRAGYKPKTIVDLNIVPHGGRVQSLGRFIGKRMACRLSQYWRRCQLPECGLSRYSVREVGIDINKRIDYSDYAEDIRTITTESINDEEVVSVLRSVDCQAIFFTGGGILQGSFINSVGKRVIHIHPGIVPDIRGADCLFWSFAIRGRPGMSCFYMNEEIDTGDVIFQEEFLGDEIFPFLNSGNATDVARALLAYYDPILRARLLTRVVSTFIVDNHDLGHLPTRPQDTSSGRTYHFMHPRLKSAVVEMLLSKNSRRISNL